MQASDVSPSSEFLDLRRVAELPEPRNAPSFAADRTCGSPAAPARSTYAEGDSRYRRREGASIIVGAGGHYLSEYIPVIFLAVVALGGVLMYSIRRAPASPSAQGAPGADPLQPAPPFDFEVE